jgi:hypothetical protein
LRPAGIEVSKAKANSGARVPLARRNLRRSGLETRLVALTTGYAVPHRAFRARVHSVFPSAANLKLENTNDLLSLVAASGDDVPQGIRVDTPTDFTFDRLHTNEPAVCHRHVLRLEQSRLVIDLTPAVRWQCDLLRLAFQPAGSLFRKAWRHTWAALNRQQERSASQVVAANLLRPRRAGGSATLRRLSSGILALLEATADGDFGDPSIVASLIGLGQGLTPAGDDLLVGYLAGLWCRVGDDTRRKEFTLTLGRQVVDLASETTDISRSFLRHAAVAQVTGKLMALAEAICTGAQGSQLDERATAAMQVGHSSGMDTVSGLLLGLAAWEKELPVDMGSPDAVAEPPEPD